MAGFIIRALKQINNGLGPDDGTGDTLRTGAEIINDNFDVTKTVVNSQAAVDVVEQVGNGVQVNSGSGESVLGGSQTLNANSVAVAAALNYLAISQASGALVSYLTKADMDADLAHDDGVIALVTNDPTPENNQSWRKSGGSGSGSWEITIDRMAVVLGNGAGFQQLGAGSVLRTYQDKARDFVSVLDFAGVDKTGAASSDAGFASAIASGAKRLMIPRGTYTISSLVLATDIEIIGEGRNSTTIQITTTSDHGVDMRGSDSLGLNSLIRAKGLTIKYIGDGQPSGKHGLYITRKVILDEVSVTGFTNDGIYFDTVDTGAQAPYFCELRNVWANGNGGNGCNIRNNANANLIINCSFNSNGIYGLRHAADVRATYGTVIFGGQASYNAQEGWRFDSGTNITVSGIYCEYNGNNAGGTVAGGYQNTPYDVYVGDTVTRSMIQVATVINSDPAHVRANATRDTIVLLGGRTVKPITSGLQNFDMGDDTSTSVTFGPFSAPVSYSDGNGKKAVKFQGAGTLDYYHFGAPGNSSWAFQVWGSTIKLPGRSGDPTEINVAGKVYYNTSGFLRVADGTTYFNIPKQAAAQANSTASTVADLVTDFNALLTKLRASKTLG